VFRAGIATLRDPGRRDSSRQSLAPLGAAAAQHQTPRTRGHPLAEAMLVRALEIAGLECPLHGQAPYMTTQDLIRRGRLMSDPRTVKVFLNLSVTHPSRALPARFPGRRRSRNPRTRVDPASPRVNKRLRPGWKRPRQLPCWAHRPMIGFHRPSTTGPLAVSSYQQFLVFVDNFISRASCSQRSGFRCP